MSDMRKDKKNVSSQKDTRQKELLAGLEALETEDLSGFGKEKEKKQKKDEGELVFLYDDDEKNPNYHPKKKEEKSKAGKKWMMITASVVGVLLAVYLGFAFYFNSHLYFSTMINGNKFGGKDIAYVEKFIEKQINDYELTLKRSDGQDGKNFGERNSAENKPEKRITESFKISKSVFMAKISFQKRC